MKISYTVFGKKNIHLMRIILHLVLTGTDADLLDLTLDLSGSYLADDCEIPDRFRLWKKQCHMISVVKLLWKHSTELSKIHRLQQFFKEPCI